MPEFRIRTSAKREMIDVTGRVADVSRRSGLREGICHVYVPHATAAIVVNENDDPNVCVDILDALGRQIPDGVWRHDRIDNNAAALDLTKSGTRVVVQGYETLKDKSPVKLGS